jgi:tape measure domain-containing protein
MKFDNRDLLEGIRVTLGALGKLNGAFGFANAKKDVTDLEAKMGAFDASPMQRSVEGISGSFIAMSTIAITALSNIVNKAVNVGLQTAKALTIAPVTQGFQEYEMKLGAIQTIMAGSGASLEVVNGKLKELNEYSDKTIYSFADMTQNIGKFTNAGVSLDQSVASIKGIANVAALSGANANEASRAMYNFAQAISSGSVRLEDWRSIELANMGTAEFKQQLLDAAVATGSLTKRGEEYITKSGMAVTATKNFNMSLQDQWMTTEALNKTLGDYASENTDIGKRAMAAAQDIKSFSQMMDTLKESVASGWAETFELVIGDFDEAKQLWTEVNTVVSGFLGKFAESRNKTLQHWKDLGGRTEAIDAFKNIFAAIGKVMEVVGQAFKEVFPPGFGARLIDYTRSFKAFTDTLKPSPETLDNIKRAMRGVFAVFSIIKQVVTGVISVFAKLFGAVTQGSGGILKFAGGVGDAIFAFDQFLKGGNRLKDFFSNIGDLISAPLALISSFVGLIGGALGSAFNFGADSAQNLGEAISPLAGFTNRASAAFEVLKQGLGKLGDILAPVAAWLKDLASTVIDGISSAFSGDSISSALDVANVGALGAIAFFLKKLTEGFDVGLDLSGGFLDKFSGTLESLTGVLEGMQANLKANALLKIAFAIGILALSLVVLASIDSGRLTAAIIALGAAMGVLAVGLKVISKFAANPKEAAQLQLVSMSLIGLAAALLILSLAIKVLSTLSWEELAKGLLGAAVGIKILVGAVKSLGSDQKGMIKAGVSLILLALAVRVLAGAIEKMGSIPFGDLIKGLVGAGVGVKILVAALNNVDPKGAFKSAAAVTVLAASMLILAYAVAKFAEMSIGEIAQGLGAIAVALVILTSALKMMPKNIAKDAAGLLIAAVAMNVLAEAVKNLGSMSIAELAKGLIGMAAALIILAVGLRMMQGTMMGSLALAVASAAIVGLSIALRALGSMSIGQLVTSLLALAAAFAIIGIAGYLLAPVAPILVLVGIGVALFGAGLLLAGLAAMAFAKALQIFMLALQSAQSITEEAVTNMLDLIPRVIAAVGEGIVQLLEVFANSQAAFVGAFTTIIGAMLDALITLIPKFGELLRTMMDEGIKTVREKFPDFIQLGWDLLTAYLTSVRDKLPDVIKLGGDIIVGFINGMSKERDRIITAATNSIISFIYGIAQNANRMVNAGFQALISFINGMTDAVNRYMPQLREAGKELAFAILDGMTGGLFSGLGRVVQAAKDVAQRALNAAKNLLGIDSPSKEFMKVGIYSAMGMSEGFRKSTKLVEDSAESLGDAALDSTRTAMARIFELMNEDIDLNPVITPVLDLGQVRKEAASMPSLFVTPSMAPAVTYSKASDMSYEFNAARAEAEKQQDAIAAQRIEFVQNNYSPKALSSIDIYRNTRSQLSLAKEALTR